MPSQLGRVQRSYLNWLDDDLELGEDMEPASMTKKDLHTLNEQKRRDVIKVQVIYMRQTCLLCDAVCVCCVCEQQGYTQLGDLVPACKPSPTGAKLSRAAILQRSKASVYRI